MVEAIMKDMDSDVKTDVQPTHISMKAEKNKQIMLRAGEILADPTAWQTTNKI